MGVLDLYDESGQVAEQVDDGGDADELESALNPGEETSTDSEGQEGDSGKGEEAGAAEKAAGVSDGDGEAAEGEGGEKEKTPEADAEEAATPEVEEEVPDVAEESRNLRSLARDQKKEIAFLKARLERLEKAVVTEPEEGEEAPVPARIEELQASINAVAQQRGPAFEVLIEAMEQNPKYADIKQVCTQSNFNYIVSSAADSLAEKEGRDSVEVALELEAAIWHESNPYKVMYEMIKTYHPKYAAKAEEKAPVKEVTEKTEDKTEKKEPKVVKAPASIADAGTGAKVGMAGWTAKRIDDLPEDELNKVPPDVYEKYMQGLLD